MNKILALGIISIVSMIVAKLLNKLKLPSVTGYLLAGLLIGPSIFNIIGETTISDLHFISDLALGLIAFHIGESFEIRQIKKMAKSVIVITFFESFIAVLTTLLILSLYTKDISFSLVVAAMSAATAPAATIMVIKEYKSKGSLTNTLVSVVAMDDIVCILLYSIATAIAQVLLSGSISVSTAIINPLIEIFGSFIIGGIAGFILDFIIERKCNKEMLTLLPMTIILASVGIAIKLGLSSLLTCCTLGGVIANISKNKTKIFETVEDLSAHIYLLFFTLSGMSLDLNVIKGLGIVGIIYIIARALGKIAGASLGSFITKSEPKIKKYLGFGLLPQAGVAIGLASLTATRFPTMGVEIMNLIMAAVFVYELIGPVFTKFILIKSGEAQEK